MASHAAAKDFQKCGEITMAVEFDKKIYALNCIFCGTICLRLDAFAVHIEDHHAEEMYATVQLSTEQDEQEEELPDEKAFLPELGLAISKVCGPYELREEVQFPKTTKKRKVSTTKNFDDPLDEALFTVPTDFPLVVEIKEEEIFEEEAPTIELMQMESDEDLQKPLEKEEEEEEEDVSLHTPNNSEIISTADNVYSDVEVKSEDLSDDEDFEGDDRGLTLAIIANYEKSRILWDPTEPFAKNRRKCDEAMQNITIAINKQLGLQMKTSDVRKRIRTIRCKFRRELKHRLPCTSTSKRQRQRHGKYSPLWYYDKLDFLNGSIKCRRPNKRILKPLTDEKPALPLPNITEEQNYKLIEIYKSFPGLWDLQHMSFRFKKQRQDAMDEMLQDIKINMNLDLSQDELQKMLNSIRHACSQEKRRKLQCERQEEAYKPATKYYKVISFLEDTVGPFRCDFCEEIINTPDQFLIHKSQHDGSMPFICPVCNHGFIDSGNYTVHLRRHTRDFPYECEVCGKRHATSTDLKVHMRYHTGDKPYLCQVCGQSCRTWTFFDKHMRRHENRPAHKCSICSKPFYEKSKLKEHMKAHLNIRDKVCNVCGKAFTNSKYLRQHRQIHAEKKKYSCKLCGKDFAQYAGLSGHMKSHGTTLSGLAAMGKGTEQN